MQIKVEFVEDNFPQHNGETKLWLQEIIVNVQIQSNKDQHCMILIAFVKK